MVSTVGPGHGQSNASRVLGKGTMPGWVPPGDPVSTHAEEEDMLSSPCLLLAVAQSSVVARAPGLREPAPPEDRRPRVEGSWQTSGPYYPLAPSPLWSTTALPCLGPSSFLPRLPLRSPGPGSRATSPASHPPFRPHRPLRSWLRSAARGRGKVWAGQTKPGQLCLSSSHRGQGDPLSLARLTDGVGTRRPGHGIVPCQGQSQGQPLLCQARGYGS